jgi:hypothetical protein
MPGTKAVKEPSEVLAEIGAKKMRPPAKMSSHFISGGQEFRRKDDRVLIAVLFTQGAEYIQEISDSNTLRWVKDGVYAADYYALTEQQVEALNSISAAINKAKRDGRS